MTTWEVAASAARGSKTTPHRVVCIALPPSPSEDAWLNCAAVSPICMDPGVEKPRQAVERRQMQPRSALRSPRREWGIGEPDVDAGSDDERPPTARQLTAQSRSAIREPGREWGIGEPDIDAGSDDERPHMVREPMARETSGAETDISSTHGETSTEEDSELYSLREFLSGRLMG